MSQRQKRRTVRHYKYQYPIIFIATYAATFLLFPLAIWFTGPNLSADAKFGPWLMRSYWVGLFPAIAVFYRAVIISFVLLTPFVYLTRRLQFTSAVFLFGAAVSIFITAFIAVWISRGFYTNGSAMASELDYALTLSVTASVLSLLIGAIVVWFDTKIRS